MTKGYTCFARWPDGRVERLLVFSTSWKRRTATWRAQHALRNGALETWIVVGLWTEADGWRYGWASVAADELTRKIVNRPILRAV